MITPIENILSRLEKVRQRQPGQWSARCPSHDDKGPSLSVRETPEGAVLLHCFAGCDSFEVAASVGIEMHELFPPREKLANSPTRIAKLLTAGQALELLEDDAAFLAILASDICSEKDVTPSDRVHALTVAGRIGKVRADYMGEHHD